MITDVQPDKQKANALKNTAEVTLQRLEETNTEKYPSNTLNDYYDVIHNFMESFTISKGIKFKGDGAHQELIDYVAKVNNFGEQKRLFLQQMRDYRNRISYEGFTISKNYLTLNQEKIKEVIKLLKEITDKQ